MHRIYCINLCKVVREGRAACARGLLEDVTNARTTGALDVNLSNKSVRETTVAVSGVRREKGQSREAVVGMERR